MSDNPLKPSEPVIACNPKTIPSDQRSAHETLAKEIFSTDSILEVEALVDGYGFRLPLESSMLHKVITFVAHERLCCPFFTFTLRIGEQFWLQLGGSPEVKDYIEAQIISALAVGRFPTFKDLEDAYSAASGSDN